MIEEAIEGVVMGVPEYHAGAGASGLAVEGPFLLLAGLELTAWSLKTLHLVVSVEATASL